MGNGSGPDGAAGGRNKLSKAKAKREAKREKDRRKKEAKRNKAKRGTGSTVEEFELDLESQSSSLRKMAKAERKRDGEEDSIKLPGGRGVRAIFKILAFFFKAFIWVLTMIFRTFGFCVRGCLRCCGEKPN